jgi:hypothetical protein
MSGDMMKAGGRAGVALLLTLLVPGLTAVGEERAKPSGMEGRGVAPSFLFFSPHQSLEETPLPLDKVDFGNRTYRFPGNGDEGSVAEIKLQDGRYSSPEGGAGTETVTLSEVRYLPPGSTPPRLAVVFLSRVYGAGSSRCEGIVHLLAVEEGHLLLHHQVTYNCHGESGARLSDSGEELEIRSVAYAPEDAHCCPSFQDVATFKVGTTAMVLSRWERRAYPKPGPGSGR